MKNGLLLLNLGAPKQSGVASVRHYLREFLLNKRVIQLNTPLRYAIVYGFIILFKAQNPRMLIRPFEPM